MPHFHEASKEEIMKKSVEFLAWATVSRFDGAQEYIRCGRDSRLL